MAYTSPKINWTPSDAPIEDDLNRIEGNTKANHEAILQEVSDRQSAMLSEANARGSADSTLQGNINTVQSNLYTESSTRYSSDQTLENKITVVQQNLNAESDTRLIADDNLRNSINNEAITRNGADITLTNRIASEESARASGDAGRLLIPTNYTFHTVIIPPSGSYTLIGHKLYWYTSFDTSNNALSGDGGVQEGGSSVFSTTSTKRILFHFLDL